MTSHAGPARRATRLTTIYVAGWGILAAVAVGYLVVLAIRPDVGAGIITRITPAQPEPTQVQRTLSKALADLQSVRQSVSEAWTQIGTLKDAVSKQDDQGQAVAALGQEVSGLRNSIAGQDERGRVLAARLAAVEARQVGGDGAANQVHASLQSSDLPRGAAREIAGATITGSVDERHARAPRAEARASTAAQSSDRAEPKHAAAAAVFGAPKVVSVVPKAPVIAGPVGLQLATAATADALRLSWLRISSGHKEMLQGLEPRFIEAKTAKGAIYRLIAGPVGTSEHAVQLCADLKSRKVTCAVAAYKGEPL